MLCGPLLQNLAKVRQIELEKAAGSWNSLSAQEKQDKEEELIEASHVAKITNVLARKTIHTLTFLTESTPEPFITGTMVDKMASTLNYYLAQLVGPKQKELKVLNIPISPLFHAKLIYINICVCKSCIIAVKYYIGIRLHMHSFLYVLLSRFQILRSTVLGLIS